MKRYFCAHLLYVLMTGYFRLVVFSLIFMYLIGCEPIDPVIPNEEELITTLEFRLVSSDQQDTILFAFQDLDGDGGLSPVIQNEKLKVHLQLIMEC